MMVKNKFNHLDNNRLQKNIILLKQNLEYIKTTFLI